MSIHHARRPNQPCLAPVTLIAIKPNPIRVMERLKLHGFQMRHLKSQIARSIHRSSRRSRRSWTLSALKICHRTSVRSCRKNPDASHIRGNRLGLQYRSQQPTLPARACMSPTWMSRPRRRSTRIVLHTNTRSLNQGGPRSSTVGPRLVVSTVVAERRNATRPSRCK